MKNLLLKIEYQGTRYRGWQRQKNGVTIEETIANILHQVLRLDFKINVSSRTDSGVHASGQIANIYIPESVALRKLFLSLNALLPSDISIIDMVIVPPGFSARKENQGKRYIFRIVNSPIARVLQRELFWWIKKPLDLKRMEQACHLFKGTHDFSAFRGKGCRQMNTVKTIENIELSFSKEDIFTFIQILIEGSGFLKNMVRIMVGTLVEIGTGRFEEEVISQALTSGLRKDAGIKAPPQGLILDKVFYYPDPFDDQSAESWRLK